MRDRKSFVFTRTMTIALDPSPVNIAPPIIAEIPISSEDQPTILEPYNVDLLPSYDYVTREYLISGFAEGSDYATRLLLRCPRDVKDFSGLAIAEPAHIWSGTSIWRALSRWIMRNGERVRVASDSAPYLPWRRDSHTGHAWLEVDSQAPTAMGVVKASDPTRYAGITFPPSLLAADFKRTIPFTPNPTRQTLEDEYTKFMQQWWKATPQSPHILAASSAALRSGQLGLSATRVFLAGLSQTGGVTRRFLTHHSHLRLPNGQHPFDVLLPCASGGSALPDPPLGVKVIELLGEAEFQSVRWACGVSGQARGLSHRRPDSDSFRLYEVAGMAHRESRYMSEADKTRLGGCDIGHARWSSFPNSFIYAAIFEAADRWVINGDAPPPSRFLRTVEDTDEIERDEHGNALGGVRSLLCEAPTSTVVAATPMGRPSWYCGELPETTARRTLQLKSLTNRDRIRL